MKVQHEGVNIFKKLKYLLFFHSVLSTKTDQKARKILQGEFCDKFRDVHLWGIKKGYLHRGQIFVSLWWHMPYTGASVYIDHLWDKSLKANPAWENTVVSVKLSEM